MFQKSVRQVLQSALRQLVGGVRGKTLYIVKVDLGLDGISELQEQKICKANTYPTS